MQERQQARRRKPKTIVVLDHGMCDILMPRTLAYKRDTVHVDIAYYFFRAL